MHLPMLRLAGTGLAAGFARDGDMRRRPDFLRTVGSRRTASAEAPERSLQKLMRALTERFEMDPRDLSILSAFGRFALERLAGECAGLDPGVPPDPRFVSCLLLDQAGDS